MRLRRVSYANSYTATCTLGCNDAASMLHGRAICRDCSSLPREKGSIIQLKCVFTWAKRLISPPFSTNIGGKYGFQRLKRDLCPAGKFVNYSVTLQPSLQLSTASLLVTPLGAMTQKSRVAVIIFSVKFSGALKPFVTRAIKLFKAFRKSF